MFLFIVLPGKRRPGCRLIAKERNMRRNLKQEIIDKSHTLFNERGYDNVSMQNIADALEISKGNLTYHFKKKEDIIEAVITKEHGQYIGADPPKNLEQLDSLLLKTLEVMQKNAYYFCHRASLSQLSPYIRSMQEKILTSRADVFERSFKNLQKNGYITYEEFDGQYSKLIQSILIISIFWTQYSDFADKTDYLSCVWSAIYPILTQPAKEEYFKHIKR